MTSSVYSSLLELEFGSHAASQQEETHSKDTIASYDDIVLRKPPSLLIQCYHSSGNASKNQGMNESAMTGSFAWTLTKQLKEFVQQQPKMDTAVPAQIQDVTQSLPKRTLEIHRLIRTHIQERNTL